MTTHITFFNPSFSYSEKVADGSVGIREHKHNQIDLWAMEEGRIKKMGVKGAQ